MNHEGMDGCTRTEANGEEFLGRGLDVTALLDHGDVTVRLEALYALERWGRDHESDRQAVVDAWSGLLRRPIPSSDVNTSMNATGTDTTDASGLPSMTDERRLRVLTQRLLTLHLFDPRHTNEHGEEPLSEPIEYWHTTTIDLSGATLIDADFRGCRLPNVTFAGATFVGDASFEDTKFTGTADMTDTEFDGRAVFVGARFQQAPRFGRAVFRRDMACDHASFMRGTFDGARFSHNVWFNDATFAAVGFADTSFPKSTRFPRTPLGVSGDWASDDASATVMRATSAIRPDRDGIAFPGHSANVDVTDTTTCAEPSRSRHVPPPGWNVWRNPQSASTRQT